MTSMSKWKSLTLAAVAVLVTAFSAAAQERVLRVAVPNDLQVLDPGATSIAVTASHAYMVYDTLFSSDGAAVPRPQMVESFEVSGDRHTYTFTLRQNLKWHDGAMVTVDDVIPSIKRWGARDSAGKVLMGRVKEIRKVNDRTFQIELSAPFGQMIEVLSRSYAYPLVILPKRHAERNPVTDPITEVIGSGPFRFVANEWVPGSKVVYRRFEDYMPRHEPADALAGGKIANFDRVEWLYFNDSQTALSALVSGEIDMWDWVPVDLLPVLGASPDISHQVTDQTGNLGVLIINHRQPPFDNPKAREALTYLIKQEDYVAALNPLLSRPCAAVFGCGSVYETQEGSEALRAYEPEKARRLFLEAGWDVTKPLVIYQPTDNAHYYAMATVLAASLRKAGIAYELLTFDWATLTQRRTFDGPVSKGGWNIFPAGAAISGLVGSPLTNLYILQCADAWIGWPCNRDVANLHREFVNAGDRDQAKSIAIQMQRALYQQFNYFPVGQYFTAVALRKDLAGILSTPGFTVYWNLRRDN